MWVSWHRRYVWRYKRHGAIPAYRLEWETSNRSVVDLCCQVSVFSTLSQPKVATPSCQQHRFRRVMTCDSGSNDMFPAKKQLLKCSVRRSGMSFWSQKSVLAYQHHARYLDGIFKNLHHSRKKILSQSSASESEHTLKMLRILIYVFTLSSLFVPWFKDSCMRFHLGIGHLLKVSSQLFNWIESPGQCSIIW